MGIMSWDHDSGFNTAPPVLTPRLTIRCEYPDTDLPPTEVTFRLSPSYGLHTARDGKPVLSGGKTKTIWPWVPDDDDLVTVTFQYSVRARR